MQPRKKPRRCKSRPIQRKNGSWTLTKIIFPTDEHCPYQDNAAISVAMQIAQDFDPDVRIAGSDGLDFYAVSTFNKDPGRLKNYGLQREIDVWRSIQRGWIDATPNAKAFYLVGNHEIRLPRYLMANPELHDLEVLQLPNLLDLRSLGIHWEWSKGEEANKELFVHNKLVIKHGKYVRKYSAQTAKAELEAEFHAVSVATGHTHRGGSYFATTRNGLVQAYECFCLCDTNPAYVQNPNWQQGITLFEVTADNLSVEQIPFSRKRGKTRGVWRGKEYTEA